MSASTSPRVAALTVPAEEVGRERVRAILPERDRTLLLARRQALLIELGALEVYLGLERSVIPRHLRPDDHLPRRVEGYE